MAKKSSKKNDMTGLIINIVVIALAVLTVCTLFMPFLKNVNLLAGKEVELGTFSATGSDVFTAAFRGEMSTELSEGANVLIAMTTAAENSFVAVVMIWGYVLTVLVSVATLVFAVLNILGMKFRLINTILGIALVVLALVTFIFALVAASKHSSFTVIAEKETGVKLKAVIGAFMMFAALIAGGAEVYKAKMK